MARIADLPLAAAPTGAEALPVVQDGTTKRMPLAAFLSQTIAAVTAEATNSATIAAQHAEDAAAAAGVYFYDVGVLIKRAAGVEPGQYFAAINLPFDLAVTSFYAQVLTGGGSCEIAIVQGSDIVYGPEAIGPTAVNDIVDLTFDAGDNVFVHVANISGSVVELVVRLGGLPE